MRYGFFHKSIPLEPRHILDQFTLSLSHNFTGPHYPPQFNPPSILICHIISLFYYSTLFFPTPNRSLSILINVSLSHHFTWHSTLPTSKAVVPIYSTLHQYPTILIRILLPLPQTITISRLSHHLIMGHSPKRVATGKFVSCPRVSPSDHFPHSKYGSGRLLNRI